MTISASILVVAEGTALSFHSEDSVLRVKLVKVAMWQERTNFFADAFDAAAFHGRLGFVLVE